MAATCSGHPADRLRPGPHRSPRENPHCEPRNEQTATHWGVSQQRHGVTEEGSEERPPAEGSGDASARRHRPFAGDHHVRSGCRNECGVGEMRWPGRDEGRQQQRRQIRGTAGRDVIVAKGGDDSVNGRCGNDVVCGSGRRCAHRRGWLRQAERRDRHRRLSPGPAVGRRCGSVTPTTRSTSAALIRRPSTRSSPALSMSRTMVRAPTSTTSGSTAKGRGTTSIAQASRDRMGHIPDIPIDQTVSYVVNLTCWGEKPGGDTLQFWANAMPNMPWGFDLTCDNACFSNQGVLFTDQQRVRAGSSRCAAKDRERRSACPRPWSRGLPRRSTRPPGSPRPGGRHRRDESRRGSR